MVFSNSPLFNFMRDSYLYPYPTNNGPVNRLGAFVEDLSTFGTPDMGIPFSSPGLDYCRNVLDPWMSRLDAGLNGINNGYLPQQTLAAPCNPNVMGFPGGNGGQLFQMFAMFMAMFMSQVNQADRSAGGNVFNTPQNDGSNYLFVPDDVQQDPNSPRAQQYEEFLAEMQLRDECREEHLKRREQACAEDRQERVFMERQPDGSYAPKPNTKSNPFSRCPEPKPETHTHSRSECDPCKPSEGSHAEGRHEHRTDRGADDHAGHEHDGHTDSHTDGHSGDHHHSETASGKAINFENPAFLKWLHREKNKPGSMITDQSTTPGYSSDDLTRFARLWNSSDEAKKYGKFDDTQLDMQAQAFISKRGGFMGRVLDSVTPAELQGAILENATGRSILHHPEFLKFVQGNFDRYQNGFLSNYSLDQGSLRRALNDWNGLNPKQQIDISDEDLSLELSKIQSLHLNEHNGSGLLTESAFTKLMKMNHDKG